MLYQYTASFLGFSFYQKDKVNAINRFLLWYNWHFRDKIADAIKNPYNQKPSGGEEETKGEKQPERSPSPAQVKKLDEEDKQRGK